MIEKERGRVDIRTLNKTKLVESTIWTHTEPEFKIYKAILCVWTVCVVIFISPLPLKHTSIPPIQVTIIIIIGPETKWNSSSTMRWAPLKHILVQFSMYVCVYKRWESVCMCVCVCGHQEHEPVFFSLIRFWLPSPKTCWQSPFFFLHYVGACIFSLSLSLYFYFSNSCWTYDGARAFHFIRVGRDHFLVGCPS